MKTHEHALISLGYAAGVALLAGHGLTDPVLYASALVGGEILDFIDHPLYHLVYNRDEAHVAEARKVFREKGLRAAVSYLNNTEDARLFKGLLLHNVYSLFVVCGIAVLASLFLSGSVYPLVALGTVLLHQLTDLYGDFRILGHVDNWLWVLPSRLLERFARMVPRLVRLVLVVAGFVELSFLILTFRIGWQLAHPLAQGALYSGLLTSGWEWLAYVPLLGLSIYHVSLLSLGYAAYHKYLVEIGARNAESRPKIQSVQFLLNLVRGRIPRTSRNLEQALLRMQADIAPWILLCAGLIILVLTVLTSLHIDSDLVIVLVPIFLALLFGTLVHTTVGEFGGVLGVLLAWLMNLLLAGLHLQPLWPVYRGYLVFGAAAGAWLLGLLGGIILKGQSRMSLVVFSLQLRANPDARENDYWIHDVIQLSTESLEQGFAGAHGELFPAPVKAHYVTQPATNMMITPYHGNPIFGEEYHQLQAEDAYVPILRELEYVLCENRLTSSAACNLLYPVMPRYRVVGKAADGDMFWENGCYHWASKRRQLDLISAATVSPSSKDSQSTWLLYKTRGEVLDHLVTRRSAIRTDLFIYPPAEKDNELIVCGITRDITSTKEYATVEAEAYAGNVIRTLKEKIGSNGKMSIIQDASARLFYPRISFYDLDLIQWAETLAVLPSDHAGFPRNDLAFLRRSLDALPVKNLVPSATANLRSKAVVLGVQYLIAAAVAALNLDPQTSSLISKLFDAFFK